MQDVFFGEETVVHIRPGSEVPAGSTITAALEKLEIECTGVRRDDTATL